MNHKQILLIAMAIFFCQFAIAQNTQIRGFANVDAVGYVIKAENSNKTYFALGQYDLFVTSQINEKTSFLGESVFEFDGGFIVDVERIIIKYQLDNHFDVQVGKFHTPLGYWNNAYHHGMVLQPTTIRPDPVKFEDEGGILPIHETGLQFSGEHFTDLNLGFNLLVSNGIDATPVDDNNSHKAVSLNLHAEPVDNLKFILSGYSDEIPSGIMNPQGNYVSKTNKMLILNGSVAYMNGSTPFEFIGEYYNVNNKMDSIGSKSTGAIILYAGYKIKRFTPYIAYNTISYEDGESYFIENNVYTASAGLRYQPVPLSVIKFEYNYVKYELSDPASVIKIQFSIGF